MSFKVVRSNHDVVFDVTLSDVSDGIITAVSYKKCVSVGQYSLTATLHVVNGTIHRIELCACPYVMALVLSRERHVSVQQGVLCISLSDGTDGTYDEHCTSQEFHVVPITFDVPVHVQRAHPRVPLTKSFDLTFTQNMLLSVSIHNGFRELVC